MNRASARPTQRFGPSEVHAVRVDFTPGPLGSPVISLQGGTVVPLALVSNFWPDPAPLVLMSGGMLKRFGGTILNADGTPYLAKFQASSGGTIPIPRDMQRAFGDAVAFQLRDKDTGEQTTFNPEYAPNGAGFWVLLGTP